MSMAPTPKRRGPPPTGKTPGVTVRLEPEITEALDRFVDGVSIKSRSEAIRAILKQWLVSNQMLEK